MSLYASTKRATYHRNKHSDTVDDEAYLRLHWVDQEKVKRRHDKPKPYRETGDSDNRLDNWEDGDEPQDNQ